MARGLAGFAYIYKNAKPRVPFHASAWVHVRVTEENQVLATISSENDYFKVKSGAKKCPPASKEREI